MKITHCEVNHLTSPLGFQMDKTFCSSDDVLRWAEGGGLKGESPARTGPCRRTGSTPFS